VKKEVRNSFHSICDKL